MHKLHGINFDPQQIGALCRRYGVVRAYLFGSILTPSFTDHSDIDVLVQTDPARPPGLFALGGLQMDLSELLGRQVHLTLLEGVPSEDRVRLLSMSRVLDAA